MPQVIHPLGGAAIELDLTPGNWSMPARGDESAFVAVIRDLFGEATELVFGPRRIAVVLLLVHEISVASIAERQLTACCRLYGLTQTRRREACLAAGDLEELREKTLKRFGIAC